MLPIRCASIRLTLWKLFASYLSSSDFRKALRQRSILLTNARMYEIHCVCRESTVSGRVEMRFTVPRHVHQYIGGKVSSADLCSRQGRYFLHIVVSLRRSDWRGPGTQSPRCHQYPY